MKVLQNPDGGLRSSVVLRVIITTVLLGSLFQRYPKIFKITQLFFDLVLASTVIFVTGGKSSPFIFLYVLIIIYSSIALTKLASYVTALVSGLVYVLIVFYQIRAEVRIDPGQSIWSSVSEWGEIGLVSTYFHLTGFLLVAILSGYLSERFRTAGRELGESERSLRILQNLHENIIQSLTSGVITLNLDGKIISANRTGLEILGISGEDKILGKDLGQFRSEEHTSELQSQSNLLCPLLL